MPSLSVRAAYFAAALAWPTLAQAEISLIPLTTDEGVNVIVVNGSFEPSYDVSSFVEMVRSQKTDIVTFDSPGGNPISAMDMGRAIRSLGLTTLQFREYQCVSACSFAFMGGVERRAEAGSIGVHQSSFSSSDMESSFAVAAIQYGTAKMLTYMVEMGVDPELLELSLSYGSDDMRFLSASEMQRLRVTSSVMEDEDFRDETRSSHFEVRRQEPAETYSPAPLTASVVEMAIYDGLDFYGMDAMSGTTGSLADCANACLANTDICEAFTYNRSERARNGPNCFFKSGYGDFQDANKDAVSGSILQGSSWPQSFSLRSIDSSLDVHEGVDIPGNDLRRSYAGDVESCRLDCVTDDQCEAFTYARAAQQCWLKDSADGAVYRDGMVSASKHYRRFTPERTALR